ncbi:hypothetical protein NP493_106g06045 [Ridgeia piscesae]|uniref:Unconventional prefoldin RPB5 interactor n=1 Tax=Ridgeia piscesae TaxID=27915 RepID=A0AAD9P795_RIDPI|nr:hypothetical protein NP493_106g06045 [Ridgeia piscesae]
MEARDIDRLKAEQLSAIKKTGERISQLEKYKNDYDNLKKQLKTLPEKVTHDVMVPFGKLAFMPGQLIHTNEITVLLGDNWFAEVSAKDAIGITERRVADIDRQIAELNKQKGLLEPRIDFTSQLQDITQNAGGLVEIKEDYDAEKEQAWKEQHRENVRQHRQWTAEGMRQGETEEQEEGEKEVWRRLEELERRELERDELGGCEDNEEGNEEGIRPRKKSVTWEDEESTSSSTGNSSGEDWDMDGYSDSEEQRLGSVIHFSHTTQPVKGCPPDGSSSEDDSKATIKSPADIYQQYLNSLKPKSILKRPVNSDQPQQSKSVAASVTTPVTLLPVTPDMTTTSSVTANVAEAFSGTVVERDMGDNIVSLGHQVTTSGHQAPVVTSAPVVSPPSHTAENPQPMSTFTGEKPQEEPGSDSKQETATHSPPKRVSKFRARRMQQEAKR